MDTWTRCRISKKPWLPAESVPSAKQHCSTGRFHHALGNVKLDEGLPVQSEKYHKNALMQYQSSIGEYHHKTADVCHRVAQHCLWREDFRNAE